MLKNYIIIAWRNMLKHKFHSALNILGLSIGIGFTLLIGAYVWSELQVNKGIKNADHQYIIQSNWTDPTMGLYLTTVGPLAKALWEQYPNLVANYYRWDGVGSNVSKGDRVFRESLQIGDSTMLNMFGFKLLYGDAQTALKNPFTVVITENIAIKYFGKKDVVGQTISIESFSGSKHDFMITGVMQMPVRNSVTYVNTDNNNQVYIPAVSIDYFGRTLDSWNDPYRVAYVELQNGVEPADLQKPIQQILQQNTSPHIARNMRPYLAPLNNYYLRQDNGLVRKMLYTVSFIALFILLMAIINFINISISKSSTRIREIGLRKVMGGLKKQLVQQFLIESIFIVFFAAMLSLCIYYFANPFMSDVLGKQIPQLYDFPVAFASVPLLLVLVLGSASGLYPAFALSAMKAVDAVKGKLQPVKGNIVLRKALVGLQFCAASIVLIGAIVATQQITLFFSRNLGYDKDFIISAQVPRDWTERGIQKIQSIRNQFASMPEVSTVALSWSVPDGNAAGSVMLYREGKDSTQAVALETIHTDEKYLDVFKIPLKAGRYYKQPADSLNLVINETAASSLGWNSAEEAIGKRLFLPGKFPVTVIGVVNDFHFGSMKNKIMPIMLMNVDLSNVYRLLCFKIKPGNVGESVAALQKKWSQLLPGSAFEYRFMDESLKILYQSEIQLQKASQVATALSLIIVVLGIIGLISLSIQKRIKEIGIRKILGASAANITSLFLKDFLPVIIIGGIISIPVAWLLMRSWLNDYTYRIDITATPFLISFFILGFLTTIIILLQTISSALGNPVKNLRSE